MDKSRESGVIREIDTPGAPGDAPVSKRRGEPRWSGLFRIPQPGEIKLLLRS
jgi:hypothetical protein